MPIAKLQEIADFQKLPLAHGICDDFYYDRDEFWTDTAGDTGASVAVDTDDTGGVVKLTTGATDNNEAYMESPELWKIADQKPIVAMARLKWTEANTDDANVMFGLMDAPGANSLLDDAGGPKASYSGAVFFKKDGDTRWSVESSEAGTQTTDETDKTATGGGWQSLKIEITPISSTEAEVTFWIDTAGGQNFVQVRGYQANERTPQIKHTIDYSSTTEIALVFGVKAGGGNSEVLHVDFVTCYQKR